jgi:DNA ligase-4
VSRTIEKCLRLDEPHCKISRRCIVEGELVVYNDNVREILDFYEIRKHVSRAGRYLGTEQDSQPHASEHLMVIFFDIMLLDDIQTLGLKHSERRQHLESVVRRIPGRAELADGQIIDFSLPGASAQLRDVFAACIIQREEGLVIKSADEPYFDFSTRNVGFRSCWVKLKKDYIDSISDVGDFAVVGATYDPVKAKEFHSPNIKWTHFWLGCLENKEDVQRWERKPRFRVITITTLTNQLMQSFLKYTFPCPVAPESNDALILCIEKGVGRGKTPTTIFLNPPVFDVKSFDFTKEGNTGFWTLRFPQVTKIHFDRSYKDAITFGELQVMAEHARFKPIDADSQIERQWVDKLRRTDPRGVAADAFTPHSTQSTTKASPPFQKAISPLNLHKAQIGCSQMRIVRQYERCSAVHSLITQSSKCSEGATQNSRARMLACAGYVEEPRSERLLGLLTAPAISSKRVLVDFNGIKLQKRQRTDTGCVERHSNDQPKRPLNSTTYTSHIGKSNEQLCLKSMVLNTSSAKQTQRLSRNGMAGSTLWRRASDASPSRLLESIRSPAMKLDSSQTGACKISPAGCLLRGVMLYLAPCISQSPWIVEDLLPPHGAPFTTKLNDWSHAHDLSYNRLGARIVRLVALVESNRCDATVGVLKEIQALQLRRPSGRKRWVEVYDWRLLESLAKAEQSHEIDFDMWRRFWVGAA